MFLFVRNVNARAREALREFIKGKRSIMIGIELVEKDSDKILETFELFRALLDPFEEMVDISFLSMMTFGVSWIDKQCLKELITRHEAITVHI